MLNWHIFGKLTADETDPFEGCFISNPQSQSVDVLFIIPKLNTVQPSFEGISLEPVIREEDRLRKRCISCELGETKRSHLGEGLSKDDW